MRTRFSKTSSFRKLQSKWYQKLKDAGFVDIESPGDGDYWRPICRPLFDHRNAIVRDHEAVVIYFSRAQTFLACGDFEKETDRKVWELHVEGATVRETARKLSLDRSEVYRAICRCRLRAGLQKQCEKGCHEKRNHDHKDR